MKVVVYFLMMIFLVSLVFGSYAVSSPTKVVVEQGNFGGFDFQVQAYTSEDDLICNYDIEDNPFEIVFDGVNVNKKSTTVVYGKVFASKEINVGNYNYEFCVSCVPVESLSGASANIRFCGIGLDIEVLPSSKEMMSPLQVSFVGIVLIIVFFILYFLFKKK
jgi:hypothetical protein|tara:strand:- start:197 stop:682 length:486 start_codon:yes stop_codon:yes gene_type:complete